MPIPPVIVPPPVVPNRPGGLYWASGRNSATYTFTAGDSIRIDMPQDVRGVQGNRQPRYSFPVDPRTGNLNWLTWDGRSRHIGGTARVASPGQTRRINGTWRATDPTSGAQLDFTFVIVIRPAAALSLAAPPTPPAATISRAYRHQLPTATGGTPPYRYALLASGGSSPGASCVRVLQSGELFSTAVCGTPGAKTWHYRVRDGADESVSHRVTLQVNARPATLDPIRYTPGGVAKQDIRIAGVVGQRILTDILLEASGGSGTYNYAASIAGLPSTLSFARTTARTRYRLDGTPTAAGTYNGSLTITSAGVPALSVPITVTVTGTPPVLRGRTYEYRTGQTGISDPLPIRSPHNSALRYSVFGSTAGLRNLGLSVEGGFLKSFRGVSAGRIAFRWIVTDPATGSSIGATINVVVTTPFAWAGNIVEIRGNEGDPISQQMRPTTKPADTTYRIKPGTAGFAGTGLSMNAAGLVTGTLADVAGGLARVVDIQAVDGAGTVLDHEVYVRIRDITSVVRLSDFTIDVHSGAKITAGLNGATGGLPVSGNTLGYNYTWEPDPPAFPTGVTQSAAQLASNNLGFDLTPSDTGSQTELTRRATDGSSPALSDTQTVTIIIRGTLRASAGVPVSGVDTEAMNDTQPLTAAGGAAPYTWSVKTQPAGASNLVATISGSTLTLASKSGTTPAVGSYTVVVTATDSQPSPGAIQTDDITIPITITAGTAAGFRFLRQNYTMTAFRNASVNYPLPNPVGATGGVVAYTVVEALPADLRKPSEPDAQGVRRITGVLSRTATLGISAYTLTATDGAGNVARATLHIDVRKGELIVFGECGQTPYEREPRSVWRFALGETLPDASGVGPIANFAASILVADKGEIVTFDWTVTPEYNGVPILEADFMWQSDEAPWCRPGVPSMKIWPSAPLTGSRRVRMPNEAGIFNYWLIALRGGQATRYVRADWWEITVLVTERPGEAAAHLSIGRPYLPAGYPTPRQWGYRRFPPTGKQWSDTTPYLPVGVPPLSDATPGPGVDFDPEEEPGGVDPRTGGEAG